MKEKVVSSIFNNPIDAKTQRKAQKTAKTYVKKFKPAQAPYPLVALDHPLLGSVMNLKVLEHSDVNGDAINDPKGLVIGNIRMGFGHYRIAMAMASAAHALGYTPYWHDLHHYGNTRGGQVIKHLNGLYSMGSRWSQQYKLFNKFYWEPLNSLGFKKLSYNAVDQSVSALMTEAFSHLPKDMPYIGTHVWPAQAAVHAGMKRVVNAIPDNWPMALHLAQGSIHAVQTPSAYWGYKTLGGMAGEAILNPIPSGEIENVGHFIDHELLVDLHQDCEKRMGRALGQALGQDQKKPLRLLLTIGGAGAQLKLFTKIIDNLWPRVESKEVTLIINMGDHAHLWEGLVTALPNLASSNLYFDAWDQIEDLAKRLKEDEVVTGVHAFYNSDIFAAVYATNIVMPGTDLMLTKPSELAFYPVPKLMLPRVGGHEAWGAIRTAELGDGTPECTSPERALQVMNLLLDEPHHLVAMNRAIQKAHESGVYNGAYNVVKLAVDTDTTLG